MRLASALIALVLTACGGGGSSAPEPAKQGCTIELNGDSLMYGLGLTERPATTLQKLRPQYTVIDKSIVGLTLQSLYQGYDTAWYHGPVPLHGPQPAFDQVVRTADVIVIEFGGNDAYEQRPAQMFEQQLTRVLQTIQKEGRKALVTGIPVITPGVVFDQHVADGAKVLDAATHRIATDLKVADAHWYDVAYSGASDTLDGIHRTQAASNLLIQQLATTLDGVCGH